MYVAPEVDSDDENVEYEDESGHRYRLYLEELEEGANSSSSRKEAIVDVKPSQGKLSKKRYAVLTLKSHCANQFLENMCFIL